MSIADVTVKKIDKDLVVFTIDAEKSKITLNGKTVDPFSSGAKVRLNTSPP
jgi:hypothetical protein